MIFCCGITRNPAVHLDAMTITRGLFFHIEQLLFSVVEPLAVTWLSSNKAENISLVVSRVTDDCVTQCEISLATLIII